MRAGIRRVPRETDVPGWVPAVVRPPPQRPQIASGSRCLVPATRRAASRAPGSLKGRLQDAVLFRRGHVAMPESQLVLQMAHAGIHPRGQPFVREFGLLCRPLHQTTPRHQLAYPAAMLQRRLARVVTRQVLRFPGAERGNRLRPSPRPRPESCAAFEPRSCRTG